MKRELELYFLTDMNKKVKISIPEPKSGITSSTVNAVMDLILQKGIFGFAQGRLVSKASARIVATDIAELTI
ncbi:hypothetical protein CIG75_17765 [Tumebacillus algifaecis]|uniref:DUF2922 domain-containing protein n=1 Tax=Tumebacillus algifaecis TaxID=1214604 RepID=A0A223D4W1_9BACL|nr:DUF2922 domain-containing protein [Tumebacillus algifaecis]ASS76632.1 hypothetical protein CIG75_17765 [Tumebacillus algifaecis]